MEDGRMMLTLQASINQDLNSVDLCPMSMLNTPLLTHEYVSTLSLILPQFCWHCFGRDPPWCSPYSVVVVQSLSRVQLFVTQWIAACQALLSFTISWSLLKFVSIESFLQVIINPSFSQSLAWLHLLTWHLPRGKLSFLVTKELL